MRYKMLYVFKTGQNNFIKEVKEFLFSRNLFVLERRNLARQPD